MSPIDDLRNVSTRYCTLNVSSSKATTVEQTPLIEMLSPNSKSEKGFSNSISKPSAKLLTVRTLLNFLYQSRKHDLSHNFPIFH